MSKFASTRRNNLLRTAHALPSCTMAEREYPIYNRVIKMHFYKSFACLGLFAGLSQAANAQSPRQALVGPPSMQIACRNIDVTPADSADILLSFIEPTPYPRETIVAYTNQGKPLYMGAILTENGAIDSVSHRMAVRFPSSGVYFRMTLGSRVETSDSLAPPVTIEDITPVEVATAYRLANSLWARSCRRQRL